MLIVLNLFELKSTSGWRFLLFTFELLHIFVCQEIKVKNSPKILGATVKNLVARATRRHGFVHHRFYASDPKNA